MELRISIIVTLAIYYVILAIVSGLQNCGVFNEQELQKSIHGSNIGMSVPVLDMILNTDIEWEKVSY